MLRLIMHMTSSRHFCLREILELTARFTGHSQAPDKKDDKGNVYKGSL